MIPDNFNFQPKYQLAKQGLSYPRMKTSLGVGRGISDFVTYFFKCFFFNCLFGAGVIDHTAHKLHYNIRNIGVGVLCKRIFDVVGLEC